MNHNALSRRTFVRLGGSGALLAMWGGDVAAQELDPVGWLLGRAEASLGDPPAVVDLPAHVLARLTFGARPGDRAALLALAPEPEAAVEAFVERQLRPESIDDSACRRRLRRLESLAQPTAELFEFKPEFLLRELTTAALLRAVYSERQLEERVVQFWTDHFNIDASKGDCRWLVAADQRDVIRAHALGRFPALLRASVLSPAMLWYLDGRVNRRRTPEEAPNENHARELLELHTLGVEGGYTQQDVMEAARCLTGWSVRTGEQLRKARVEFQRDAHDDGAKTVLGRVIPAGLGEHDVEALLDIVALHPSTARHLATKLARRFVADDPPAGAIDAAASAFLASGGDLRDTLRALFRTPEFRASAGLKLKRPLEFLASALRATEAVTDGGPPLHEYLRRMGHGPHQFPTPDGYPDEAAPWLGTLLWRWKFAEALVGDAIGGTRVDLAALARRAGGRGRLAALLLGRQPTVAEAEVLAATGHEPGVVLASPAFQLC